MDHITSASQQIPQTTVDQAEAQAIAANPGTPSASPAPQALAYFSSGTQITFVHEGRTYNITKAKEHLFAKALESLRNGTATSASLCELVSSEKSLLSEAMKLHPNLTTDETGKLFHNGFPVHASLAEKLRKCLDEGFGAEPFLKFIENLALNPRMEVMENLYSFLEYGKMAIDSEGHFLAYKAVREDFKDIYTGTFDNSIGQTPKMAPWAVDPDRNRTCSVGLHVCSFDYLPHFSHANGHVMVVRVNPKDVIAIPADYHDTKMRVSEYTVIDEYKGYYDEHRNVLANRSVVTSGTNYDDEPFLLSVHLNGHVLEERFALRPSASEILSFISDQLEELADSNINPLTAWTKYTLVNSDTQEVLTEVQNEAYAGEDDGRGITYIVLGHTHDMDFEPGDEDVQLVGSFQARNRAMAAVTGAVGPEDSADAPAFIAVFAVDMDGEESVNHALDRARCVFRVDISGDN